MNDLSKGRPSVPDEGAGFLRVLFWLAQRGPRLVRASRGVLAVGAFTFAKETRRALLLNATRIQPWSTTRGHAAHATAVLRHFILFIVDIARSQRMTPRQILARVESIDGAETYQQTRDQHTGAIIVTAHLGSFEVGMAVVADRENEAHVVFARDPFPRFEAMRSALRQKLGVVEARVEHGWPMWTALRDALAHDAVVVMQGDRLMPGQKGEDVKFMSGHIRIPSGPVRLAMISGAPILPIFTIRGRGDRVRVVIESPIMVDQSSNGHDSQHDAMQQLANVMAKHIEQYSEQWLMLQPVWREDQEPTQR